MHLLTVAAFACLFWQAEEPGLWVLLARDHASWIAAAALAPLPLIALASSWATRRAIRTIRARPEAPHLGPQFHHRAMAFLRAALLAHFAALIFLTDWPALFAIPQYPAAQILGDLLALGPFVVGLFLTWLLSYPLEKLLRADELESGSEPDAAPSRPWGRRAYMDFQVRHHFLVVAAPMTLILFAANLCRGYKARINAFVGWDFAADILLGVMAAGVFVFAPALLRRIWRTAPLEPGLIRDRLEAISRRIGLRFREILVWRSDGLMINAAVMGLIPRCRYVMLSDGLLASMNAQQIEAVFGHEVGHLRHRHIPFFLLFALVGWFAAVGVMEGTRWLADAGSESSTTPAGTVQAVGLLAAVIFWGTGFGWLSRRFERQADLFGAQCVAPPPHECRLPCSVHLDDHHPSADGPRVCMTGVSVFASALDRVAALNGIPHDEHSWRHPSIGSRMNFLRSLAGDPQRARRFDRQIRRAKALLVVLATLGSLWEGYFWLVSGPA